MLYRGPGSTASTTARYRSASWTYSCSTPNRPHMMTRAYLIPDCLGGHLGSETAHVDGFSGHVAGPAERAAADPGQLLLGYRSHLAEDCDLLRFVSELVMVARL